MDKADREIERNAEEAKLMHDYLKHLATLTTGSILLLVTFLQKVVVSPKLRWAIILSFIAFSLSIVSNIVAQSGNLEAMHFTSEQQQKSGWFIAFSLAVFATWITFLLGLLSLVIFALGNML